MKMRDQRNANPTAEGSAREEITKASMVQGEDKAGEKHRNEFAEPPYSEEDQDLHTEQGGEPPIEIESHHNPAAQPLERIEAAIGAGVERIIDALERKLARATSKQEQIDRLHDELQQHRNDLVARAARPLMNGMIRLHDDIGKLHEAWGEKPPEELTPDRFLKTLADLQEDVEIVLAQNGVAAYRQIETAFEPRRQRAVRRVVTDDRNLAGSVAKSLRPGFEQGGNIIEKERIAIYQYQRRELVAPEDEPGDTISDASAVRGSQEEEG